MKQLIWIEDRAQKVWLWVGVVFAAFYFGEAFLFWGPVPRVKAPPFLPLAYWGAFGAVIIGLLSRQTKKQTPAKPGPEVPASLQSAILGMGITASVVGITFLVIAATHNVTLGHAVLLGTMFEAGIVIGGMSGNIGWLLAGLVWAACGVLVYRYPSVQDYTLGVAVFLGFATVGVVRWSVCRGNQNGAAPQVPPSPRPDQSFDPVSSNPLTK
jgi:hypothetical protein